MLQIMIMLIFLVVIAMGIFGGYKKNIFLLLMNISFIGMLVCMLCYFVKMGGALPVEAVILYGLDWILNIASNIVVELNTLGRYENIFRFLVIYFFFMHALYSNVSVKNLLKRHQYVYYLTFLPILGILIAANPSMMYGNLAYNYDLQSAIVTVSFVVIVLYLVASFVLLTLEYHFISLSWYKKQHLANILQMTLFCIPYIVFAQFDPIVIYQDYMRVCVFTNPILLAYGSSLTVWVVVFFICVLALIIMIVTIHSCVLTTTGTNLSFQ